MTTTRPATSHLVPVSVAAGTRLLAWANVLAAGAASLWLCLLGDWSALGLGLAILLLSVFVLSPALLPAMFLTAPAAYYAESERRLGLAFFSGLGSVYVLATLTAWCGGLLWLAAQAASLTTRIPRLLGSLGVAFLPWQYLSWQEGGPRHEGSATDVVVMLAEIAYAIAAVLVVAVDLRPGDAVALFAAAMLPMLVPYQMVALRILRQRNGRTVVTG
ncbi:MAG: hypothetical protein NZ700_10495 [Gemmataceae bacterium]|nr:hypothetical protein [Gemmataceae bacterium]MDW8265837.1 hypothetical protein [Gemmataceae bacterium]